ncbi:MAG TPA: glycoside hydrolase family 3 C-terminal domain-containing protein [Acetivibrio sp.]|mgnify:CR=1 FL=1|uniref:glycoside hydrolase family 3 C-terminal domain-containing protein n=1 Tax=Acetivibrio sp. TaxID=1872092 RepID=UPI002BC8A0F0|nr:glycoside hydrolase family 3 C-terminal domain-containing protein [Acetivibrio sp.]HOM03645.1 glycoside hydrolase family 3 C-terminal domain-containing protein [Acetivibrio sp.]
MTKDIKKIIKQMTLEEKAGLCSGLDGWRTKPVERLDIPSIMMTDGPHGLRKQKEDADVFDINNSVPATCFPTAAALACSWDRELIEKVGIAIGEECQAENVSILLGPGVNIKRSPLCGRNFEYFSEDPYLSSEMAASHIKGVQSQGVGTSLKHFAANNQEYRRMTVDTVVDERTLREIYFASFENAVKKARPWTVMCAYNKLNGEYCSENRYLLTDILKNEWMHDGFVVSDWGAVNDRVKGLDAGLDLEMPSSYGITDKKIVEAVKSGKLSEKILDRAVERILKVIFMALENKKENASYDKEAHHRLARQVAAESMVLLKNEDDILPLRKSGSIALIGAFVKKPRYQGAGSSHITPTRFDDIYEEIKKTGGDGTNIVYSEGYRLDSDEIDEKLINEAKKAAANSDVAVIFAGLPDEYESEGFDRTHMRMPENQNRLIEEVAKVQSNIAVVLLNGSPVEMPWIDKVKSVLEAYLGGQALGGAVADVLFGEVNPSGKLAETFPVKLSHNPSYLSFPGEDERVEYKEGLFVGYRYYDTKGIDPLFPFGHGLSYTKFEYSDISVDKKDISDNTVINVSVKVKNVGKTAGKEIVQLYVKDVKSSVRRPEKELKGFEKIFLGPGEEKTVTFTLDKRAFAYYNTQLGDWYVESGEFLILIGKSSRDIVLKESVRVNSTVKLRKKFSNNSTIEDIMSDSTAANVFGPMLLGLADEMKIDMNNTHDMMVANIKNSPLRSLINSTQGRITEEMLDELLDKVNGAD